MDQSARLKYECFYCYFKGDHCWVAAEVKHVRSMGVTDSLTKFGETEGETEEQSVSRSVLVITNNRLPRLKQAADEERRLSAQTGYNIQV